MSNTDLHGRKAIITSLDLASATMANADYHAHAAIGSSSLKALDREGPEYAYAYHAGELRAASSSMAIGSAVHAVIDGTYHELYSTAPSGRGFGSRDTQAFAQHQEEMLKEGDSRTLLTASEAKLVERCGDALKRFFGNRFNGNRAWREPSLFWQQPVEGREPLACKCRPDILIDDGTGGAWYPELKTSTQIGDAAVRSAFWRYGYWIQQSQYEAGILACGAILVRTRFVFVRTVPPHDVRVYAITGDDRDNAAIQWRKLVADWARRRDENDWTDASLDKPRELRLGVRGEADDLEQAELLP